MAYFILSSRASRMSQVGRLAKRSSPMIELVVMLRTTLTVSQHDSEVRIMIQMLSAEQQALGWKSRISYESVALAQEA
ncbi:hypothetical protein SERLA73DRAFT_129337 [Serpula lacrymans var. lacrymans S7.3]|uniref:Uncharacterized protein n=2 Tax=Serpula lacrymans var. lacrymans TaxID=341189 RepID=F8PGG3_SERL3|nr:uncharacterized protein SERLADRAFT_377138 [Serpula lacrymans var. lacrymans S7.9]EGO05396.1 hypothetical protein SERLA73DRAFT_129337 [Serpula lacrymans var. lacrymans S7.3]EGO31247.1 hypothetical protein SERLADRAFT_377138 [Serpula lacrymans var. lacrymans S7.9]